MSNYMCIHCETCQQTSNSNINRGEQEIEAMFAVREHLTAIYNTYPFECEISLHFNTEIPRFLHEHRTHELWLMSEYGKEHETSRKLCEASTATYSASRIAPDLEKRLADLARMLLANTPDDELPPGWLEFKRSDWSKSAEELSPDDPLRGWWDRKLAEGDEQTLQMLRNIPAVVAQELEEPFSLTKWKEYCVTYGYGSRETMYTLFPEEEQAE